MFVAYPTSPIRLLTFFFFSLKLIKMYPPSFLFCIFKMLPVSLYFQCIVLNDGDGSKGLIFKLVFCLLFTSDFQITFGISSDI